MATTVFVGTVCVYITTDIFTFQKCCYLAIVCHIKQGFMAKTKKILWEPNLDSPCDMHLLPQH